MLFELCLGFCFFEAFTDFSDILHHFWNVRYLDELFWCGELFLLQHLYEDCPLRLNHSDSDFRLITLAGGGCMNWQSSTNEDTAFSWWYQSGTLDWRTCKVSTVDLQILFIAVPCFLHCRWSRESEPGYYQSNLLRRPSRDVFVWTTSFAFFGVFIWLFHLAFSLGRSFTFLSKFSVPFLPLFIFQCSIRSIYTNWRTGHYLLKIVNYIQLVIFPSLLLSFLSLHLIDLHAQSLVRATALTRSQQVCVCVCVCEIRYFMRNNFA